MQLDSLSSYVAARLTEFAWINPSDYAKQGIEASQACCVYDFPLFMRSSKVCLKSNQFLPLPENAEEKRFYTNWKCNHLSFVVRFNGPEAFIKLKGSWLVFASNREISWTTLCWFSAAIIVRSSTTQFSHPNFVHSKKWGKKYRARIRRYFFWAADFFFKENQFSSQNTAKLTFLVAILFFKNYSRFFI